MATAVIMPRQGQSVESCIITKWHKKEGDPVKAGDLLFTYETDKSTFDEEAKVEGVLLKILHVEDDDVPCLENVCIIGAPEEDVSAFVTAEAPAAEEKKEEAAPVAAEVAPVAEAAPAVKAEKAEGFVKISPRARNLAERIGLDYRYAQPTGAEGRIIERDINALAKAGIPEAAAEVEAPVVAAAPVAAVGTDATAHTDEKMSNIRKVIAKQMYHSITSTCQLTHTASFDATEILEFRKKIKPKVEKGELNNITLNDIVMYVVARTLTHHKALNAHLLENDVMRYFEHVNLGMAVDTPRGLMVPTCFMAEKKTLNEMSKELKALAAECQTGTISPDKLAGGTFTVSNLGSLGVEHFTPVLNVPQTGILGVNNIVQRIKVVNGEIKAYPCMSLSLTYDHRALDGAPASKFLKEVCNNLENFTVTLATL